MKRKMTPKQRVLRKWPKAYAYKWAGPDPWCIYADKDGPLQGLSLYSGNGSNATAAAAWADAARNLK